MFLVSQAVVDAASARYNSYKDDPSVFDPPIADLVHTLNKFEGIATTWSCAGHAHEEETMPHVVMVVSEKGWDVLLAIATYIEGQHFESVFALEIRLATLRLYSAVLNMDYPAETHPNWRLEARFKGDDDKAFIYMDEFFEGLVDYLNFLAGRGELKLKPVL